jgi:hypothetical protein
MLRPLKPAFPVIHFDHGMNAAPDIKIRGELEGTGFCHPDEILKNPVRHLFVKVTFVAETPQIKFKAFEFHAPLVGDIRKMKRRKVGLSGLGAKTRKLRAVHADLIISLRIRVPENFQLF